VDRHGEDDAIYDTAVRSRSSVCAQFLEWKTVTSDTQRMALAYLDDAQADVLVVYTIFCQTSNHARELHQTQLGRRSGDQMQQLAY
jgi:succinylglutamate desuccinylase